MTDKQIQQEINKAIKININNVNQIISNYGLHSHENLKEDYKDLKKFIKKLFQDK